MAAGGDNAPQGGIKNPANGDPEVWAIADGAVPARRAATAGVTCTLREPTVAGGQEATAPGSIVTNPVEGETYFLICDFPDGTFFVRQIVYSVGVSVVDAGTLARQAYRILPLSYPHPSTAPPDRQLAGVRTWLWIDPDDYRTVTATVEVPGLQVTATATPERVRWQMGSPSDAVACDGPGTPYDPSRADDAQQTTCSYVFQRSGDVLVTVYIDWSVTWEASDGTGGVLPPVARGRSFVASVDQRQAVITR
jgi:hypothetical protein